MVTKYHVYALVFVWKESDRAISFASRCGNCYISRISETIFRISGGMNPFLMLWDTSCNSCRFFTLVFIPHRRASLRFQKKKSQMASSSEEVRLDTLVLLQGLIEDPINSYGSRLRDLQKVGLKIDMVID